MASSTFFSFATKFIAACAVFTPATAVFAHVTLDQGAAQAATYYKAALRVGHGCEGSPTHTLRVQLPAGFQGAKPMPKAGWAVSTKVEKLKEPYDNHGRPVLEDVTEITWKASAKEFALADAHYDEFVLRGRLPAKDGAMWFKVQQLCDKGQLDWAQVPASGTSTKGLQFPAALLDVLPAGQAGHAH